MILHDAYAVHLHSVKQLLRMSSYHRSGNIEPLLIALLQSAFWATNTAGQYLLVKWTGLYRAKGFTGSKKLNEMIHKTFLWFRKDTLEIGKPADRALTSYRNPVDALESSSFDCRAQTLLWFKRFGLYHQIKGKPTFKAMLSPQFKGAVTRQTEELWIKPK